MTPTAEQFAGCLFGLAIGDALGAPVEGLEGDLIRSMGPASELVKNPSGGTLYYTDDTQMTIGVAETLVACGEIRERELCAAFAENYDPKRGYGQGARRVIEAMAAGDDWRELAASLFPGGSYGNGGAMRVAPVGLLFCDDLEQVAVEAERSSRPTHIHPLGIDGARLIAIAVALALRGGEFHRETFLAELLQWAETEEFKWQLGTARELAPWDSLVGFGNSLEAHRSVVTAIACFTSSPDDYLGVVTRAISQGNDTDTLAAMAGAISGARLGISAIPSRLVDALEDQGKGRRHLAELAERLHRQYIGHRNFVEKDTDRGDKGPKHRWYQFSLLELLLVTTLCAVVLGGLRFVGIKGLWGEFAILSLYSSYFALTLYRVRRVCIENDLWHSDPVQAKSDSRGEL